MLSVNSNFGASVALQSLNNTNKELNEVQNRISTGLKVASARDNGAVSVSYTHLTLPTNREV